MTPLKWNRGSGDAPPAGIVADRRLYVTRDRDSAVDAQPGARIVEEGDPDAAFLLAAEGDVIPDIKAQELGLAVVDGKVVQRAASVSEPPPAEPPTESVAKPKNK